MIEPALALRRQLVRALDWEEAHVGFDQAVNGIPARQRGERPAGARHSAWQLVEHMRLAQQDLLDFCVNDRYAHSLTWPDDYWPADPAPPDATAWRASIARFVADRKALKDLVRDTRVDLFSLVPTGSGEQTCLRAVMLVIDHTAYHVGQLVALRHALGIWK